MPLQIRVCIAVQKQFKKQDEQEIITEEITKTVKIEDKDIDISSYSNNECSVTNVQEVLLAVDSLEHNNAVASPIFQHCYICKYQNLQSE